MLSKYKLNQVLEILISYYINHSMVQLDECLQWKCILYKSQDGYCLEIIISAFLMIVVMIVYAKRSVVNWLSSITGNT